VNDRLILSPSGTVLDPVQRRPYHGPLEIRVLEDRIEVRALLDERYTLAKGVPADANGEAGRG
jgi:hypothetical protein